MFPETGDSMQTDGISGPRLSSLALTARSTVLRVQRKRLVIVSSNEHCRHYRLAAALRLLRSVESLASFAIAPAAAGLLSASLMHDYNGPPASSWLHCNSDNATTLTVDSGVHGALSSSQMVSSTVMPSSILRRPPNAVGTASVLYSANNGGDGKGPTERALSAFSETASRLTSYAKTGLNNDASLVPAEVPATTTTGSGATPTDQPVGVADAVGTAAIVYSAKNAGDGKAPTDRALNAFSEVSSRLTSSAKNGLNKDAPLVPAEVPATTTTEPGATPTEQPMGVADVICVQDPASAEKEYHEAHALGVDQGTLAHIRYLEKTHYGTQMRDLAQKLSDHVKAETGIKKGSVLLDLIRTQRFPVFLNHLQYGSCDVNDYDASDKTALQYAVLHRSEPCLRAILAMPTINVNATGRKGITALHTACQNGYIEGIGLLLAKENINVNATDDAGRTPLHYAVIANQMEALLALLQDGRARIEKGAPPLNVNQADWAGLTPLELAVDSGRACLIPQLVRHGASLTRRNQFGLTPLHAALRMGDPHVVSALLYSACHLRGEPVRKVPTEDHPGPQHEALRKPLSSGVDEATSTNSSTSRIDTSKTKEDPLHQRDSEGDTPLHYAARRLPYAVIAKLVRAGARLDELNKNGLTAYDVAVQARQPRKICNLLRLVSSNSPEPSSKEEGGP